MIGFVFLFGCLGVMIYLSIDTQLAQSLGLN
jgi:hypothetical protein